MSHRDTAAGSLRYRPVYGDHLDVELRVLADHG
jgi:hypothetical protein